MNSCFKPSLAPTRNAMSLRYDSGDVLPFSKFILLMMQHERSCDSADGNIRYSADDMILQR